MISPAPIQVLGRGGPRGRRVGPLQVSRRAAYSVVSWECNMPQGQLKRFVSRKRRVLQRHCRNSFSRTHHKSSIATWNLRRPGQGNWGESWLKLGMLTRTCAARGWRAILLSYCFCDGSGAFHFKGLGGSWLVVFNGRCEFCWTREWPTCGGGEANDAMIPLTAVLWRWLFRVPVVVFGVGFVSCVGLRSCLWGGFR